MAAAIPDWSFNAAPRQKGYTFQRYGHTQAELLEQKWILYQADVAIVLDSDSDGDGPDDFVVRTVTLTDAATAQPSYVVDLSTMTQRNLRTGYLRDVRRVDRLTGSEHGGPGGVNKVLAELSLPKRRRKNDLVQGLACAAAAPEPDAPLRAECQVCFDEKALVPAAAGCAHGPMFCEGCIAKHIEADVYAKGSSFEIGCPDPGCTVTLEHGSVLRLATPKVFAYYDRQTTTRFLRSLPGFQWCKNSACGSGQETVDGERHPIVTCHACRSRSCFMHDAPWHKGMTCDQYDVHLKGDQNDAATRHYYQQNTKPCPKCQQAIQKDSGCDHMTCRPPLGCGHEFCWRCTSDYEQILRRGNHHHKPTCTYYAPYDSDSDDDL